MNTHVDTLSHEELESLAKAGTQPCISIYMPTYQAGTDVQQNSIRLRELLKEAESRLTEQGMRRPEAVKLLEPGHQLLGRSDFWTAQSDGLALFISPAGARPYRLPKKFTERVVVNNRFYLKPLLSALRRDGFFYILTLSQSEIRLLRGSRYNIAPVPLEELGVPKSKGDALKYDQVREELQMHTFPSGEPNAKYGQTAIMHGQGTAEDDPKTDIKQFFQMVDAGLHKALGDGHAPLVLAGVEYLLPIYREVNSYPGLAEQALLGNPKALNAQELHTRAWPIVEPFFEEPVERDLDLFRQFMGERDKHASKDLKVIVPAAFYGRVAALFVDRDSQVWGRFDSATEQLTVHPERKPEDDDLLDLASVQTVINNGTVYPLERNQMPDPSSPIAAVFRY